MGIFVTTMVILTLLFMLFRHVVNSFHDGKFRDNNRGDIFIILCVQIAGVIIVTLAGPDKIPEGACIITVGTTVFYFLTLSFIPKSVAGVLKIASVVFVTAYVIYRLSTLFWDGPVPGPRLMIIVTVVSAVSVCVVYALYLGVRIADVKFVLRAGAAWNSVCMVTDVIYLVFFLTYVSIYVLIYLCASQLPAVAAAVYSMLLLSIQYALAERIMSSSLFVIWDKHETRIVESMRLGHAELSGESPGIDVLYKSIYDRVLDYFEEKRPYLNNELTINDIVNVLYTNKLYISKAISIHTGRNFCQFVNYYRITYAVEIFRKNPNLKIVDVAGQSGFNSPVSFSMAFRLYIGQKPSDWFRQERARLLKRKK